MRTKVILAGITIALLGTLGAVWLKAHPPQSVTPAPQQAAGPLIGAPKVSPSGVNSGVPTSVFITVDITNSMLITSSVNLLRLTGSSSVVLTRLYDDATNGDVAANDRVYSARVTFNESQAGEIRLQVSAAFTGLLARATSPVQIVTVVPSPTGTRQYSNVFYQFSYPAQYTPTVRALMTTHQLNANVTCTGETEPN